MLVAALAGCAALVGAAGCDYVRLLGWPDDPAGRGEGPATGEPPPRGEPALPRADDPFGGDAAWSALRFGRRDEVDLLFVVANRPGMAARAERLAAALPRLAGALARHRAPVHYHIGVITGDLGTGDVPDGTCRPGGDGGVLQTVGAGAPPGCLGPRGGVRFIDLDQRSGTDNLPAGQDLAATFRCMSAVGESGCDFQQPLEAARRALDDTTGLNRWFLRDGATLAVVVLAGEDDCSAPAGSDLFRAEETAVLGPRTSYRCAHFGVTCGAVPAPPPGAPTGAPLPACRPAKQPAGAGRLHDVERYLRLFTARAGKGGVKRDPNDVVLLPIVAPADPFEPVLVERGDGSSNIQDPGYWSVGLRATCTRGDSPGLAARPAVRLAALAAATNPGVTAPVCDDNFDATAELLAEAIQRSRVTEGCLPAALPDGGPAECEVLDVYDDVDGPGLVDELPRCGHGAKGACWRIAADPGCAPIPDPATGKPMRRRLVIERAFPAPPTVTTHARCRTAIH